MPTPLERLESLEQKLKALLQGLPSVEQALDRCVAEVVPLAGIHAHSLLINEHTLLSLVGDRLAGITPFTLPDPCVFRHLGEPVPDLSASLLVARIEAFCLQLRQTHHADLAAYWSQPDEAGLRRREQLLQLRREQLRAELGIRQHDQTLAPRAALLLQTCLDLPEAWQRQLLPVDRRPQVYRPLLSAIDPSWRAYLPGTLVIVENSQPGTTLDASEEVGQVLLCSLSHGLEAFPTLTALHTELCERLDDPRQRLPMVRLFANPEDAQRAVLADRLRYQWLAHDPLEEQIQYLLDTQRTRLNTAWIKAWQAGRQRYLRHFDAQLALAMDLTPDMSSQGMLETRYALLLEKHLPAWLRSTSQQGVTQIMQTLQELVAAIEQAAAPGIPTLEQFQQPEVLRNWVNDRLRKRIFHDHGIKTDPRAVFVTVTVARAVGPLLNPALPSSYIPVVSRPQVGGSIELVSNTRDLIDMALLNVAWIDIDYWLTARVHTQDNTSIRWLTPDYVKTLVRSLNAGSQYADFLRFQLIDSAVGQWRQHAHAAISCARMRAEAVKARYAGHFLEDRLERGYRWVITLLNNPESTDRPTIEEHPLRVRQLTLQGHTVQGVLLLNVDPNSVPSFVLYTPDAPDRRAWREYRNTRDLLRTLRDSSALRRYVTERMPHADATAIDKLLLKGRLGPATRSHEIKDNLFQRYYQAEVQALLASVEAGTRSTEQINRQSVLEGFWLLVDLISLVLPSRALVPLALGRATLEVLDVYPALQQEDYPGVAQHFASALSHGHEALTSYAGSTFMRRALRGVPIKSPLPMPKFAAPTAPPAKLRYRLDGIYGEGVFEKSSPYHGVSQYYIQDKQGRYIQISFDGERWRAIDPDQPDAYLKVPLKRRAEGEWVVDSPVLWYDGLPDLQQLLDDCLVQPERNGTSVAGAPGLLDADGYLYLVINGKQLAVRRHLLANHYHLLIPESLQATLPAWATLRWQSAQWHIRVRQTGRSSDWLALPQGYLDRRGNS